MWRARAGSAIMTARAAVAINTAAQGRAGSPINYPPVGAWARQRMDSHSASLCPLPLQPHATPTIVTGRPFADQFDARGRERVDELHQRIDISPEDPVTQFHALDRRQRWNRALVE